MKVFLFLKIWMTPRKNLRIFRATLSRPEAPVATPPVRGPPVHGPPVHGPRPPDHPPPGHAPAKKAA